MYETEIKVVLLGDRITVYIVLVADQQNRPSGSSLLTVAALSFPRRRRPSQNNTSFNVKALYRRV
jgi:hypothetical protein